MWFALAVWFAMDPPMVIPIVKQTFNSKSECVEYIISNSDFNKTVYENHNIIILDDGIQDRFGAACQTRTQEV